MAQRLFIIDAMALAFRSFYALGRSSLATSQGIPTGAIYGAAMFMNKLIVEQKPDYLVAVTDTDEPTFRHEIYQQYKATRDRMPEDLAKQIPVIFDLFAKFHCPLIRLPGIEADDVIGTVAKRFAGPQLDALIVSGDKDFMQLIDDHIFMLAPKKNEEILLIDRAGVREKFSCTPEQVIDVLALIGDSVDNVPGVAGIGEKGAAKLIETYGSLDGIYAHLDQITAKKQKDGLLACRDDAYLSRRLVTLKTDVDLPLNLSDMRCDPKAAAVNVELLDFYRRFEFKTLATKTAAALAGSGQKAVAPPAPVVSEAAFTEVASVETQAALLKAAQAADLIAMAIVATGSDLIADKASTLAIVFGQDAQFLIPLTEEGIYLVRPLLLNPKTTKVMHGLKFMLQMLYNVGLDVGGPCIDLEICDYLIDPNNYNHALDSLATRYLGQMHVSTLPTAQAATTLALHGVLQPKLEQLGLLRVLREVDMPLVPVLAQMERDGFYIDPDYLDQFSNELAKIATELHRELLTAIGEDINVNSPKQLQELLFEKLKLQDFAGIKRLKKTKTGLSTDESVLMRLAAHHPVPRLILEYRGITKLKNTYVDTLPQFINPRTGRVHTSFRQTVAATGRLSSDRPNLQNIPMHSTLGRKIREAFRPQDPDFLLISADYSQVEIRLLAHLAKADGLIEAFKRGLDIHTVTAAKIFGRQESEVDNVLRSRAKAVNFGIIYGMGPQRLALETGVSLAEAKDFIRRYFEVYPGIKTYTEGLISAARQTGYCVTMLGRRRPIPEIRDQSRVMLARGESIAVNAPIQGSAADLIKLAMIRVHAELRRRKSRARMLLQVHDELVFAAPQAEVPELIPMIREQMEHAIETSVPLKVEIHTGKNWLEAH